MKKCRGLLALCVALCLMAMLVPASALDMRASDQIYYHFIDASVSGGEIVTQFTVWGNVTMDKLGCQSITISEKRGSSWISVASFDEDDTGMSRTDGTRHSNSISWSCKSGVEYRVSVTVFAENSAEWDVISLCNKMISSNLR